MKIQDLIRNNQSINISLDEDFLIKDTLVIPSAYDKQILIEGNGFCIKVEDPSKPALILKNPSVVSIFNVSLSSQIILDNPKASLVTYNIRFVDSIDPEDRYIPFVKQKKGTLKCYGCYFKSNKRNIIKLNERSLEDCHTIICCHIKSDCNVESDFISIHGNNNEVCVMSTYYETTLGAKNNLVHIEKSSRSSAWVLGCVFESTPGSIIKSSPPSSNSVIYGIFKDSTVKTFDGHHRNKISFDIYEKVAGHYHKSSKQEGHHGVIMHNEPTYDEVSATPTIKHPDTITKLMRYIDLRTKATRYLSLAEQEDISGDNMNEIITVFDQCSLSDLKQTETKCIFLNSYLEEYYKTNEPFLFVNPYDSFERKTRVRFANRKKGTW